MSSNGSVCNTSDGGTANSIRVDIERSNRGSEANFAMAATNIRLAGWSGWNNIPMDQLSFGGGSTQTTNIGAIRLTFYSDGAGSSYSSGAHFYIQNLYLIGSTYWTSPSNMAKTGHLYDYDATQSMILPKDIYPKTANAAYNGYQSLQWLATYSKEFYENGTSLVNKYLGKTAQAADSAKLGGKSASEYYTEMEYI